MESMLLSKQLQNTVNFKFIYDFIKAWWPWAGNPVGVKLPFPKTLASNPTQPEKQSGWDVTSNTQHFADPRLWMSTAVRLFHLSALCRVRNGHLLRSYSFHRLQLVLKETTELCFWPFQWLQDRTADFSNSCMFMKEKLEPKLCMFRKLKVI